MLKKKKCFNVNVSKHISNREKQLTYLMISNEEKWHYSAVKKLSALLRGITSKHHRDFYCLNCFHSLATENKLQLHKRACENKDFSSIIMPSEDAKI